MNTNKALDANMNANSAIQLASAHTATPLATLWLGGAVVLALDALGVDQPMAHWFGGAGGFPWQQHWLLTSVLHSGARAVAWVLLLALTVGIWRPVGVLRTLSRQARTWMVASMWLSVLVVVLIKGFSTTACPWDLAEFGGSVAYQSHWSWLWGGFTAAPGPGHCFPAGHASTAFTFLALPLWFRDTKPEFARRALWGVLAAGLVLGVAQQMRGAHFLSHTLWSAWLCWAVALGVHRLAARAPAQG